MLSQELLTGLAALVPLLTGYALMIVTAIEIEFRRR